MQFTDVQIQPSYGKAQALVWWTPDQELINSNPRYRVYRSPDGAGGWEQATTEALDRTEFLDTGFRFGSRTRIPHYRVLAVTEAGDTINSPVVGLFEKLPRAEYAACQHMIRQTYMTYRKDGVPVLHYIPKTRGQIVDNWDPDTNQVTQMCEDSAKDGYGQKYVGGYRTPYYTWVQFQDTGPIVKVDRKDGTGILDEFNVMARMLCFPRPERGHLLVHPATDDRYMVTNVVKPFKFRGLYPISYFTKLELLERENPAYRLPLPDNMTSLALP